MPRNIQVRSDYSRDVASLARIARAIQVDTARDPAWRLEVIQHLHAAIAALQADGEKRLAEDARRFP